MKNCYYRVVKALKGYQPQRLISFPFNFPSLPGRKSQLNFVIPLSHQQNSDKLAEFAESLSRSLLEGAVVKITYSIDRRYQTIEGMVKRIDQMEKAVLVEYEKEKQWILAQHIFDVEI